MSPSTDVGFEPTFDRFCDTFVDQSSICVLKKKKILNDKKEFALYNCTISTVSLLGQINIMI